MTTWALNGELTFPNPFQRTCAVIKCNQDSFGVLTAISLRIKRSNCDGVIAARVWKVNRCKKYCFALLEGN